MKWDFTGGLPGLSHGRKKRWTEFCMFPTYQRAYIRAFGKMLEAISAEGIVTKWKMAEDVFSWWMEEETVKGQICLSDLEEWRMENEEYSKSLDANGLWGYEHTIWEALQKDWIRDHETGLAEFLEIGSLKDKIKIVA